MLHIPCCLGVTAFTVPCPSRAHALAAGLKTRFSDAEPTRTRAAGSRFGVVEAFVAAGAGRERKSMWFRPYGMYRGQAGHAAQTAIYAMVAANHLSCLGHVSFESTSAAVCHDVLDSLDDFGDIIQLYNSMHTSPRQAVVLESMRNP